MALGGYVLAGFILGFILIFCYVVFASDASEVKPELGKAVGLFLAANGITASIRLFILVVAAKSLGALTQSDRVYVAIGALAALWLSVETIGRIFRPVIPEETKDEDKKGSAD